MTNKSTNNSDYLSQQAIDWAITHIRRFGDTDIFPVPFEYEAIKHSWANLKKSISEIDIATYEGRPFRRMLVPKHNGGYRVAIQLDPIDTIIYTALAYEAAELIENTRIPIHTRISCSYRVELGARGDLFRSNNGWDDFHAQSQNLAQQEHNKFVVIADIADYYNQIGHHRIRNSLEYCGVTESRAKNIENLLMNFTRGQSRGILIGPSASALFSEACLSDVDNFLLRKGYVHTRYVDDFRIFCRDESQAHKALHDLTEYLYASHRLSLQSHKTKILGVNEFIVQELIDPESIENQTQAEKLEALEPFFNRYEQSDDDEEEEEDDYSDNPFFSDNDISEPDIDEIIRDNLSELFEACLSQKPLHLGTAKYLLRRATKLRTGLLRETVLSNIEPLTPIMREVTQYIIATTQSAYAENVCRRFIDGCTETYYDFMPYIQSWLLELLLSQMPSNMANDVADLCISFKLNLGHRPYALLARKQKYYDWVREQKETWHNNSPWDRRAIIWAAKALSNDEMRYWLLRVQNAGDILDKAIAESILHTENL